MCQPGSSCGVKETISPGLLLITNFVTGWASGVRLYSNYPYKCAYAGRCGRSLDCCSKLSIIVAFFIISSRS